jgi:hypothetical protein
VGILFILLIAIKQFMGEVVKEDAAVKEDVGEAVDAEVPCDNNLYDGMPDDNNDDDHDNSDHDNNDHAGAESEVMVDVAG